VFDASSRYKPNSKQTSQNKTSKSSNSDVLVVGFYSIFPHLYVFLFKIHTLVPLARLL